MSKRTLGLILFLAAITGALLYIALVPKNIQNEKSSSVTPSPKAAVSPTPKPVGHSVLSLLPNPVIASSSSTSMDIVVDSNGDKVTAVQAEISFDPQVLTPVSITQGTFFKNPFELLKKTDAKNGRISYAIATSPNSGSQIGSGVVATIKFNVNPASTVNQTQVTLLPKSLVTAENIYESVLIKTNDTTVTISTSASPTQ